MLYPGGRSHEKDVIERITPEKSKEKSPVSDDLPKIDIVPKPTGLDQPYDKSGDLMHGMGDISDTGLVNEPRGLFRLPEQYKEAKLDLPPESEPGMD
jgi:hypothetical protein